MCNISRDIIRYFPAVASEDPVGRRYDTHISHSFSLSHTLTNEKNMKGSPKISCMPLYNMYQM